MSASLRGEPIPPSSTYPVKEENSTLTLVLRKGGVGWKITAWTWTMG